LLPRASAVVGAEHAPLWVLREEVPDGGDVDDVGIGGMNDDARDVMRIGESHELPRLARVGRLEDALAGDRRPRIRLVSAAEPDDLRIRGSDRNGADRFRAHAVGDVRPRGAGVCRLPESAAPGCGVDRVQVVARGSFRHVDRRHPRRGTERPDVSERERVDDAVDRGRLLRAYDEHRCGERQRHDETEYPILHAAHYVLPCTPFRTMPPLVTDASDLPGGFPCLSVGSGSPLVVFPGLARAPISSTLPYRGLAHATGRRVFVVDRPRTLDRGVTMSELAAAH